MVIEKIDMDVHVYGVLYNLDIPQFDIQTTHHYLLVGPAFADIAQCWVLYCLRLIDQAITYFFN